jgi:hypothetical protein
MLLDRQYRPHRRYRIAMHGGDVMAVDVHRHNDPGMATIFETSLTCTPFRTFFPHASLNDAPRESHESLFLAPRC